MKRVLTLLAALGVLIAMGWSAQRWSEQRPGRSEWSMDPGLLDSGAGLGVLLLGAWFMGRLFALVGIPQLVGYLVFGVVVGPSALKVVTEGEIGYLALVNDLAIALIALTAGGEMHIAFLRKAGRTVLAVAGCQIALVIVAVTFAFAVALPRLGWTDGLTGVQTAMVALVIGTVSIASSPAVLLAVLSELNAQGPMSRMSLAITVCKDLGLVVLFTIVLGVASASVVQQAAGSASGGAVALSIGVHLIGSLVLGAVAGLLTGVVISRSGTPKPAVLIIACVALAAISERLHLELLLVAVAAGMVLANGWPHRTERLFDTVMWLSTPVYCVFFAVAGAKLDLGAVAQMWPVALGLAGVRAAAVWAGTRGGLALVREKGEWTPWLWTAFVPQAGVTLALAMIVEQTFADQPFGPALFTLLVAAVAVHELVGPILLKVGLVRSGEVPGSGGARAEATGA
jgi:Kef-type K+ transport system membrane component KefB